MKQQLNCIIIDDEAKDRENLRLLLGIYCPQVNIIGEAKDKISILKLLTNVTPDLAFVDIQLGAITIFEVLNEIENLYFNLVFVTAYDKYAIQGYQYDAIDYLLKPINPNRLKAVVSKSMLLKINRATQPESNQDFKELYKKIMDSPTISLADSKGAHIVKISDILYCNSDGNYTVFNLNNDKKLVISKNLKHFEFILKARDFFRIHKSFLINLQYLDLVVKGQVGSIIMKNGKSLPLARSVKNEFYKRMNIK